MDFPPQKNRFVTGMCEDRAFMVKGGVESRARVSSPATTCLVKGCGTGILPVFHGFIF
jgi:hypothetical protein